MAKSFAAALSVAFVAISLSVSVGDDALRDAAERSKALAAGAALPGFESLDDAGRAWKSADHAGQKVLVMYFYPGDFTGGCTKQAQTYRDTLAKIEELGAEVVGVSGDEVATHKLFKQTYGLTHSLLADPEGKLGKLMGISIKSGGKVRATGPDRKPLLDVAGKRIEINRPVTLARCTIIVGRDGKIASLRSSVNPVTDAEETLKLVEALSK